MKRIIAVIAAFILLVAAASASASPAGTTANPLITLGYLNGAFADSIKSDVSSAFEGITTQAMSRLGEYDAGIEAYSFAPRFTPIKLLQDDKIKLSFGGSVTVLSGSAVLTSAEGAVVNVSAGNETAAGSALVRRQRYFCAEGSAEFTVSSAVDAVIDGYHVVVLSEQNMPHPAFTDVIRRSWYYPAVDFVYTNGLFEGTGRNTFSPSVSMTRAMFVTVLHRLEGTPDAASTLQFTDVQNSLVYYYKAVAWASGSGIVGGYEDGTFRPDSHITREQMAAIMFRYAAFKQSSTTASDEAFSVFPDNADVSVYAADSMKWAVSHGVINGSNGYLRPKDTATRAQVAQIILNYTEKIV